MGFREPMMRMMMGMKSPEATQKMMSDMMPQMMEKMGPGGMEQMIQEKMPVMMDACLQRWTGRGASSC